MSGVAHSSYSRRGIFCNGFFAHALDRLLEEALSGQVASRSQPRPAGRDDPLGTSQLGIQRGQSRLDVLGFDPARLEVVPDEQVSLSAPGQLLGSPSGEPCVVDSAGTHEPVDSLLPHLRGDVRPRKPVRKLPPREVPVRKRPRRAAQSLVPSQLAAQPSRSLPVELDAHVEPRREHDFSRQGPPRLAFELDLDSLPWPGPQRANPWRRPSP